MIRTKKYLLKELSKKRKTMKKLQDELVIMNNKKHLGDTFASSKVVLRKELLLIQGDIRTLLWVANTSEKTLPKLKKKKITKPRETNPDD